MYQLAKLYCNRYVSARMFIMLFKSIVASYTSSKFSIILTEKLAEKWKNFTECK